MAALENNLHKVSDMLINKISMDGWRGFLGKVGRSNARVLYKYLSRATDESRWEVAADEIAPIETDGRCISGGWEKCEAIAAHFAAKLSTGSRRAITREEMKNEADAQPLSPFRGRVLEELEPVERIEVDKAVDSMALGKAPGPNGVPAEMYARLPAMRETPVLFFNAVLRTGKLPIGLTGVAIVPLLKPGENPAKCQRRGPISLSVRQ